MHNLQESPWWWFEEASRLKRAKEIWENIESIFGDGTSSIKENEKKSNKNKRKQKNEKKYLQKQEAQPQESHPSSARDSGDDEKTS